ncbi:MAG TPA: hypothetical protein VGC15_14070 [Acetobacteraceae bacterium]
MSNTLDTLRAASKPAGGFNLDAWHAMDDRDMALVADELMHGAMSSAFVYSFTGEDGQPATGISVAGARHLAAHYGGIKHRIVLTVDKRGPRSTLMTQPHGDTPAACKVVYEAEWNGEPDWYRCTVEVTDVKKGNTVQVTIEESSVGRRRDGSTFPKAHYPTIAESKAYRNAVLALIPQDVTMAFKVKALALGRSEDLTADVIGDKRDQVIAYATSRAILIDRKAVQGLSFAQIAGLADAARTGGLDTFHASLAALGLLQLPDSGPLPLTPTLSRGEREESAAQAKPSPTPRQKPAKTSAANNAETAPRETLHPELRQELQPEPGTTTKEMEEASSAIPKAAATAGAGAYIRNVEGEDAPTPKAASAPPDAAPPAVTQVARSLAAEMPTRSRKAPPARVNGTANPSLAFGDLE